MRPRRTSSTIPTGLPAHRPGRRNPLALRGRARYPAPLCRRARARYGRGGGCAGEAGAAIPPALRARPPYPVRGGADRPATGS